MTHRHILNFWPLVPPLDIETAYEISKSNKGKDTVSSSDIPFDDYPKMRSISSLSLTDGRKDMNILIIGDGLGCLIKTIARMYRHETENLNIFFISNFAESLTRKLLLLSLLYESSSNIGILDKTEMFLEIFGNTFLRPSTYDFVETKSANILKDIVSSKNPISSVPSVYVNFLKQKEIDEVCGVLTYLKNQNKSYNIAKAWDNSLRSYFGTRYDNRKRLFDYQFNMNLSQHPIINLRKYLEWCETGVAFKLRKGRYESPNKTLCINSFLTSTKSSDLYFGDISTSPYIAFGVESGNASLFEKVNNQFSYTSEDLSKFNIMDLMTEFYTFSASQTEKNLNIYPLFYPTFCKRRKFENFFDAIYVTCDMTSCVEHVSLAKILNKDGIVIFETVENVVNSTKEQKVKHSKEIDRLAKMNSLTSDRTSTYKNGCFKIFVKDDTTSKE